MSVESFRAFRAVTDGETIDRGVVTMSADDLPDGALVDVRWSSVNYKDGLASIPKGQVASISPLVPGIDLAGVLSEDVEGIAAGTEVLAAMPSTSSDSTPAPAVTAATPSTHAFPTIS